LNLVERTPQQNGVVEREKKKIYEMAKEIINEGKVAHL